MNNNRNPDGLNPPPYELGRPNQVIPLMVRYPLITQMGLDITPQKRKMMLSDAYNENQIRVILKMPFLQMMDNIIGKDVKSFEQLVMKVHNDANELSETLNGLFDRVQNIMMSLESIDGKSRQMMTRSEFIRATLVSRLTLIRDALSSVNATVPRVVSEVSTRIQNNCGYGMSDYVREFADDQGIRVTISDDLKSDS